MQYRKLWFSLGTVVLLSFLILGYFGHEIYVQAPPIPTQVVDRDRTVLFTKEDIQDGQNVWQSMGGQQLGSVWGHGAYVAPDWSADFLHKECLLMLNKWSQQMKGLDYSKVSPSEQASLRVRLADELRTNTYSYKTDEIVISKERADAVRVIEAQYKGLFSADPQMAALRKAYAIPANALSDPERLHKLVAFFFWAAWSCSTDRPNATISYTNNWPHEALINNVPSTDLIVWSIASCVFMLAGIGALCWYYSSQRNVIQDSHVVVENDPLVALVVTPSMNATLKYFWIAGALFLAQIGLGVITAHYGVEGNGFYGFQLDKILPYAVTRTWHTHLAVLWIATTWLATGLFIAPAVSGVEPKYQRLGVDILFLCLLIIVVGSMAGQWLGVMQKLGYEANFWFGHQGYEYTDLGRFWQVFLFAGLFIWLGLMVRAIAPAFKNPSENKSLLGLFLISTLAIAAFYGAGLMWDRHTNLAVAEYWRWWVVHLWVEGFFEVFATVVIAFLFTRMGLLQASSCTASVLFSTVIFLAGGIIGTFHHLYFTGTPLSIIALGASFSALEVVPLVLIGQEASENLRLLKSREWVAEYKWPVYFFVAVAFWNLVGAGLFGFLINTPIALFYMQGLNTTAVHGHTALFGVYGMLGIGLMLFCLKGLSARDVWDTKFLSIAFWCLNIGLALMVLISLLPVGIMQTCASISAGMWYARSAEFLQQDFLNTLRWMRVIGDVVFALGVLALAWFTIGLKVGWSIVGVRGGNSEGQRSSKIYAKR
jgi:nitric oxide reductase subunit B